MNQLTNKICVAYRVGAPLATAEKINGFMQQLPHWKIVEKDEVKRLKRVLSASQWALGLAVVLPT